MNLFEDAARSLNDEPLAARMRPRTLDEYIGQEHILGKGRLLRRAIQADQLSSVIFYGPPGTGKTTLARVIANTTKSHFSTLNAVLSGVKELRGEIEDAKNRREMYHMRTILFIDEVHRWNKSQQDALLPWVENGTFILIGATTENPFFEVNAALVSRSRIFQLKKLTDDNLHDIAMQAIHDEEMYLERNPDSIITANVEVTEMMGSETYLFLDVAEAKVTARVAPTTLAKPGDTIKVCFEMDKIHLFDIDTEEVIIN